MRRFEFGLGLSHLNELFAFCWSCCKMQKWRSLVLAALTAQFWSHEPQAAVDSSCLSLALSLRFSRSKSWKSDTPKTWTSSMFRCSCWELNPSYAVFLLFLLCVCVFSSPRFTQTQADCPALFRAVTDQQVSDILLPAFVFSVVSDSDHRSCACLCTITNVNWSRKNALERNCTPQFSLNC